MAKDVEALDLSTRRPPPEHHPTHLLGWSTERLVILDALAPGLLQRLLTSAPMSRQAIFAAVACVEASPQGDTALAPVLLSGKARDIITHVQGEVPEGLLGALDRIGGEALPRPSYYSALIDIFVDPVKRPQAMALRHCGRISKLTIDAVAILDERWLLPQVLLRAENLRDVVEFQGAVSLLQSLPRGPSDAMVRSILLSLPPRARLGGVIGSLVMRSRAFADQPVVFDEDFRPLASAEDLVAASRQFRNCLRHKVLSALTGWCAYAVYGQDVAIAEFRRLADKSGWVLFDIHAPRNDTVPPHVRAAVRQACATRGIPQLADPRENRPWEPVLSMAEQGGVYDWAV